MLAKVGSAFGRQVGSAGIALRRQSLSVIKDFEGKALVAMKSSTEIRKELQRLAAEAAGKGRRRGSPSFLTHQQHIDALPTSKLIAELCITRKGADVTLAMDLLLTLMKSGDALIWRSGILDLLDRCLDHECTEDAIYIIKNVCHPTSFLLDLQLTERLVEMCAVQCRLDDLEYLLSHVSTSVSQLMLLCSAEPLIMSGRGLVFATALQKYTKHCPPPEEVEGVIRTIILARTRRLQNRAHDTQQEVDAVTAILPPLESYHLALRDKGVDVEELESLFVLRQLFHMEGVSCDAIPYPRKSSKSFAYSAFPKFDRPAFPYLTEESAPLAINDLTTELSRASSPQHLLLYSKDLFPSAFQSEMRRLKSRGVQSDIMLRATLMMTWPRRDAQEFIAALEAPAGYYDDHEGALGDDEDDDDDDDDDEEDDDDIDMDDIDDLDDDDDDDEEGEDSLIFSADDAEGDDAVRIQIKIDDELEFDSDDGLLAEMESLGTSAAARGGSSRHDQEQQAERTDKEDRAAFELKDGDTLLYSADIFESNRLGAFPLSFSISTGAEGREWEFDDEDLPGPPTDSGVTVKVKDDDVMDS